MRLAQIFGNLLNNAARYTESGGTISVEARRESLEAVVVDQRYRATASNRNSCRTFSESSLAETSSAKRNQSGLGIGLALVRRLTEMHGGRVDAQSDGPGKGSRFTVRLPLNAAQQAVSARSKPDNPVVSSARILVIDDNSDAAESLRMLLEHVGADVRVARRRAGSARGFYGLSSAHGAAGHRHARHGRLRGRPASSRVAAATPCDDRRPHGLGPG